MMDDRRVCTQHFAESDAQNNTTSTPIAASATDADKVINNKTDSTQVEGCQSEEELLKGLLTDDYCHVCEAVLLFESQRLSHYEGKKHAQKLKVYLQTKRAEKMNKEATGPQWTLMSDKDRFCELCNMVFSSPVVAKSHYEGKVHIKNLRKQCLHPSDRCAEVCTSPSLTQDPGIADQQSSSDMEQSLDPIPTTASTEVDLKDSNKYCVMCAASFNNPQMALQHYNGRKHQRNEAKQELLKELGDDDQQANSLMCQMCSVQFNSVEMYQAHMQGNKHQIREKKVIDLCKSQQKTRSTFADELADYIQVQKARGITHKSGHVLSPADAEKEEEEDEREDLNEGDIVQLNKPLSNLHPTSYPPHHPNPCYFYPAEGWHPSYQGPPWPSRGWDPNCPPPVLPGSDSPQFTSRPMKRMRHRKQSSSSSYTTSSSYSSSSYSSSYSSSTSDSDSSEHRRRERRRIRRSRRERGRRPRDEDSDKEEMRGKQRRRVRDKDSEERRREEYGESGEERRRKKRKHHVKRRRRENISRRESFEDEGGERVTDNLQPEDIIEHSKKETEVHIQAEINVEHREGGRDESAKPKYRREKKKTKEKADTRTEEEKLWDDSILGC